MIKWLKSLVARKPLPPLAKPWPTEADVIREVVISLMDQPAKWTYHPPRLDLHDYGATHYSANLTHCDGRVVVLPDGTVCLPKSRRFADDAVKSLFWTHPAVVAAVAKADEDRARPLADAIQSLRS